MLYLINLDASKEIWFLLIFASIIGLPHGLTDFMIFPSISNFLFGKLNIGNQYILPIVFYVSIALAYALIWVFIPLIALILFLIISIIHFGYQDIQTYGGKLKFRHLQALSRGVILILLPYLKYPTTSTYFNILSNTNSFQFHPNLNYFLAIIALLYVVISLCSFNLFYSVESMLLISILLLLTPLLSFTIYFCIWHTPRHYISVWLNRKSQLNYHSYLNRYLLWGILIFTLVIFLALSVLMTRNAEYGDWGVRFFFYLISSLTISHVLFNELNHLTTRNQKS
jgi:beta-carotene 15,15'-dioxygenase